MNYPKEIKAFYMRLNDDGRTVAAMDVLAPGIGEIIGGSQREERLDVLDARIDEIGLDPDAYGGTATCAATAPSRTPASASASSAPIVYATGMANIRDVIPFPRTPGADFSRTPSRAPSSSIQRPSDPGAMVDPAKDLSMQRLRPDPAVGPEEVGTFGPTPAP